MERKIKVKIDPREVYIDEELYPRAGYNWQTGYDYSQSMLVGAKFPPIILAKYKGKNYLVDGRHRCEGAKTAKMKVEAIIHTGWNKKRIFLEAVKSNITHGRPLSPYEKRSIALKLREMNLSQKEISQLIQVPLDKLETFVGSRLVSATTGDDIDSSGDLEFSKKLGQAVIKSSVKHLAGQTFDEDDFKLLQKGQKELSAKDQLTLFKNIKTILEDRLLDVDDEGLMTLVAEVKRLLRKY